MIRDDPWRLGAVHAVTPLKCGNEPQADVNRLTACGGRFRDFPFPRVFKPPKMS
jgi:hypothetical protein